MKYLEVILWIIGAALLLFFFAYQGWGNLERQRDVSAFTQGLEQAPNESDPNPPSKKLVKIPDDEVIAILRIAAIEMELPVRVGTEERVLRRGPGLIDGTAFPGTIGNVAIAAHRDQHFRGLKDLKLGDMIEVDALGGSQSYTVTSLSVVDPEDVHVLDEVGRPVLTLVTCYPFYFVGNAPNRFIVRAEANGFNH